MEVLHDFTFALIVLVVVGVVRHWIIQMNTLHRETFLMIHTLRGRLEDLEAADDPRDGYA